MTKADCGRDAIRFVTRGTDKDSSAPNWGTVWSSNEELYLVRNFTRGECICKTAKALGRDVAGCVIRLVRLGYLDQNYCLTSKSLSANTWTGESPILLRLRKSRSYMGDWKLSKFVTEDHKSVPEVVRITQTTEAAKPLKTEQVTYLNNKRVEEWTDEELVKLLQEAEAYTKKLEEVQTPNKILDNLKAVHNQFLADLAELMESRK